MSFYGAQLAEYRNGNKVMSRMQVTETTEVIATDALRRPAIARFGHAYLRVERKSFSRGGCPP